jgi:uncharacterized protein (DUF934 family)
MSNLIKYQNGTPGIIAADPWQIVHLPVVEGELKKQAGKPVLFKLTGAETTTPAQVSSVSIPVGKVLLPKAVWLARQSELAPRVAAGEVGVWLETHELVETLVASVSDLNVFPVIGVHIERFADGRAYSMGTLLRTRHGFGGELRVFGDVLRDQLFFLRRVGFDAYEIRADRSAQDALASLQDFSEPYQGAVVIDQPVWRRYARG